MFSGWDDIFSELHGEEINRIDNLMTLTLEVHRDFGKMRGWLEATAVIFILASADCSYRNDIFGGGEKEIRMFEMCTMKNQWI